MAQHALYASTYSCLLNSESVKTGLYIDRLYVETSEDYRTQFTPARFFKFNGNIAADDSYFKNIEDKKSFLNPVVVPTDKSEYFFKIYSCHKHEQSNIGILLMQEPDCVKEISYQYKIDKFDENNMRLEFHRLQDNHFPTFQRYYSKFGKQKPSVTVCRQVDSLPDIKFKI